MKRRFSVYSHFEDRSFDFEAVLDLDFAGWFVAIQNNIEVIAIHFFDCSF